MYPQLLILGNGFDAHCGLASSYECFFRSSLLDTVGELFELNRLKEGVTGFWENLLLEYHTKVYEKDDYNWCKIEEIIKTTLLQIYFGSKVSEKNLNAGIFKNASKYLSLKLEAFNKDKLNDIEKFLFDYCYNFLMDTNLGHNNDSKCLNLLTVNLLKQLKQLENRFCKYLKNQIVNPDTGKINENYIVNAVNLLAKLDGFTTKTFSSINEIIYRENRQITEATSQNSSRTMWKDVNVLSEEFAGLQWTHILSFNYTALFDILDVKSPCSYNNVHGKLCNTHCTEGCNSSNVIFGIDDALIDDESGTFALRMFSKTYRKMLAPDIPTQILPTKHSAPLDIKFYGHSLSEADYSYFQSIFDYYDVYGNSNVTLIFYYSKGHEQHDAIYRLINEYGNSLANKKQGKNLIHKLLLENRLKIQEVKE